MSERELIHRIQAGDREAFARLVETHHRAVYGFLRARLFQSTDADDLTQEVFLRFYTGRDRFDPESEVSPWLLGIARNLLREHARKHRRRRDREEAWTRLCLEVDERQPQPDGPLDEALHHLPECMSSLGQSARQAIDLKYTGSLALSEIGTRLRRSEGAIKLLIFRARRALKSCLEGKIDVDA